MNNEMKDEIYRAFFVLSLLGIIVWSMYSFGEHKGSSNCDVLYQTTCIPEEREPIQLNITEKIISAPTFNQLIIFCNKYSGEKTCEEFKLSRDKYGN